MTVSVFGPKIQTNGMWATTLKIENMLTVLFFGEVLSVYGFAGPWFLQYLKYAIAPKVSNINNTPMHSQQLNGLFHYCFSNDYNMLVCCF